MLGQESSVRQTVAFRCDPPYNWRMKFVAVLGLLFAIVFGLVAFERVISVSLDTASATTGGLAE